MTKELLMNKEDYYMRMIFKEVHEGAEVSPRGLKTREVENFSVTLPPRFRWMNFEARNLNLDYVRAEIRWYLSGDRSIENIRKYASYWNEIATKDGHVNSNYGQYWFNEGGIDWVLEELKRDRDSRRAVAPILKLKHLRKISKDIPCTYVVAFRIRNGKLNCSVHMRSQDLIWGLGNDLPAFSILHEMVAVALEVPMGTYHHAVDSLHVYEKHWGMVCKIVDGSPWTPVECPKIADVAEARCLIQRTPRPMYYSFTRWLYDERPTELDKIFSKDEQSLLEQEEIVEVSKQETMQVAKQDETENAKVDEEETDEFAK